MTDLTLRREDTTLPTASRLIELLKEMFAATPLGLMIAAFTRG